MKSWLTFFDLQGLVFGIVMTSLGVLFLKSAGFVTGQLAGLSLLLSYVTPYGFGLLYTLVSLPFFVLAWVRRGPVFTLRTVAVVLGISLFAPFLATLVSFDRLDPVAAAVLAGACSGVGLVAIFRHNASAGGATILAIVIEERTGLRAGWVQLMVDVAIFAGAAFVLSPMQLGLSFLGAVIMNLIIAWNFNVGQVATGEPG
ncbi:MAG: YitT family protein [Marinibacterium sp.]|nr:YitT family protein [Marinibacterium sp.]